MQKFLILRYGSVMVLFFSGIFTGFAEAGSEIERESLRGLPGVVVMVEDIRPDAKRDGISEEAIRTAAELILRSSRIRILTDGEIPDNFAMLYINIGASKSQSVPLYGYCITVQLNQSADLINQPGQVRLLPTWHKGSFGIINSNGLEALVTKTVESLTKEFANDFLSVNSR